MPIPTEQLIQLTALAALIIVLIYWSGWFSGMETALTRLDSLDLAEMKRQKVRNIKRIFSLKRDMNRTLITILIGNNIVNVALSAVTALAADSVFHQLGVSLAVGAITFLIIIFGDIIPKSTALADARKVASKRAAILYFLTIVFNPLTRLFTLLAGWILRLKGIKQGKKAVLVTDWKIKELATLSQEEGQIKTLEKKIIHHVFHFGDKTVRNVMIPLARVAKLPEDCTMDQAVKEFRVHGYTRLPLVSKGGRVTGVINVKSLVGRRHGSLQGLISQPLFVSAKVHVTTLFERMQQTRIHIAIVEDGHGRHIGLATMEDLLEELVGEIYDEFFLKKQLTS